MESHLLILREPGDNLDRRKNIFHFKPAQNFVAEHYERDFDMIFHFKPAQKLVAEHYERDFVMVFHSKAAQNLVAEHYERGYDRLTIMAMNKNRFSLYDTNLMIS